jgi:hypothetical protein
LGAVLIIWLILWLFGFFGPNKGKEIEAVPEENSATIADCADVDIGDDREGCVECAKNEKIQCTSDNKKCWCEKEKVVYKQPQPKRNLCAECEVGYKSKDSMRKHCSHVCSYSASNGYSSKSSSKSSSKAEVNITIKDDDDDDVCTDCDKQYDNPGSSDPDNEPDGNHDDDDDCEDCDKQYDNEGSSDKSAKPDGSH